MTILTWKATNLYNFFWSSQAKQKLLFTSLGLTLQTINTVFSAPQRMLNNPKCHFCDSRTADREIIWLLTDVTFLQSHVMFYLFFWSVIMMYMYTFFQIFLPRLNSSPKLLLCVVCTLTGWLSHAWPKHSDLPTCIVHEHAGGYMYSIFMYIGQTCYSAWTCREDTSTCPEVATLINVSLGVGLIHFYSFTDPK